MGGQQQPRREIKLMHSIARVERVEDPNVWKPKHAVKNKDDDPDKIKTEVLSMFCIFFKCLLSCSHLFTISCCYLSPGLTGIVQGCARYPEQAYPV